MTGYDPAEDLAAIRAECQAAADVMLASLERVLDQADRISGREPEAADALRDAGLAAMEACAFQDIVGQRLTRIAQGRSTDPLLQGPAGADGGLDQAEIDRLLASA